MSNRKRTAKTGLRYLDRTKGGQIYFRVNGKRIERLPDGEASSEFAAAYARLLADFNAGKLFGGAPAKPGRPRGSRIAITGVEQIGGALRFKPPTIGWFIEQFLASDYFKAPGTTADTYAAGTQINYRAALDLMKRYKMNADASDAEVFGACNLADLTPELCEVYLADVKRRHGGSAAEQQRKLISKLWDFARGFKQFDRKGRVKPTVDVGSLYKVQKPHEPWPEDIQDRFTEACDTNLYLAFHLLFCTGQRVSDVVNMKWSDFDGERFRIVQKKTGHDMWIKAPKKLLRILDKTEHVSEYVLTHKWKRPYTRDSLGHRIKDVLIANGDAEFTAHGLRANAGILLAENGATDKQIMAVLGHASFRMVHKYIAKARQKVLNEQGIDIMDAAFERRDAAKTSARRAKIQRVA